jgi:hypothetical protein
MNKFYEKNQRFLIKFGACVESESVFGFFPALQVFMIIVSNDSPKPTEKALIEWLRKMIPKCFPKTNVYVDSLVLSLVFKTIFGIFFFSTSGEQCNLSLQKCFQKFMCISPTYKSVSNKCTREAYIIIYYVQ